MPAPRNNRVGSKSRGCAQTFPASWNTARYNAWFTRIPISAVVVKNAGETEISLPAGTKSILTDSSNNTYDEDASGVIYSADNLLINGSGTLTVKANYKDGISGNDDIRITQTKLFIDAVDDGVKANDSV